MLFLCVNVYCHQVTTQLQLINIINRTRKMAIESHCEASTTVYRTTRRCVLEDVNRIIV